MDYETVEWSNINLKILKNMYLTPYSIPYMNWYE